MFWYIVKPRVLGFQGFGNTKRLQIRFYMHARMCVCARACVHIYIYVHMFMSYAYERVPVCMWCVCVCVSVCGACAWCNEVGKNVSCLSI
jgi:hypothetical protein